MQFSEEKQAAMRAAFLADLAIRLDEIDDLIADLRSRDLSDAEATAAALTHLHDIKGCGRPYGVPQATELARDFEARLRAASGSGGPVVEVLSDAVGALRRIAT